MLLREDGDAVVCIGQPAHAWLAGQIARNWSLGRVEPWEEVCLAADLHDMGMAEWDAAPELNPATGRPYSFTEMPLRTHLRLWTAAPALVLTQSRYAALLTSMHGAALYGMRDLSKMSEPDADAVRAYIAGQRELQERLGAGLDPLELRRNQGLIWVWDFLSLALCLRWSGRSIRLGDDELTASEDAIEPWPFRDDAVALRTEGRRLEGRFTDQEEMRAALAEAPWVELRFALARS
jgi:hypothetical protein